MPVVRFTGKVYPESARFNSAKSIRMSWGTSDFGFPLIITLTIVDGHVETVCEVEHFDDEQTGPLLHRSYQLAEAFTDLAAFGAALPLRVEFDAVFKPGNPNAQEISMHDVVLSSICRSFKFPPRNSIENLEFDNVFKLVLGDPTLMGSLRDLNEVQHKFNATPTNCGRILDALRRGVAPRDTDKKKGWRRLQKAINADEVYLNWVSAYSTDPRHGDYATPIYGKIIREIRTRTWTIMDRYIEYRKGANIDLDQTKFPLLVHDPSFPFPTP